MFTGAIGNILGEVLWHSHTADPTIDEVSTQHFNQIKRILETFGENLSTPGRQIEVLEVAAYAHTSGYMLANELGAEVTLADISIDSLALGREIARKNGIDNDTVVRIASDFHDLPFCDDRFDLVYIASALHHTWSWQKVLSELARVVKPGGLLFLENEPCAREFCFYKFRTNRKDQYRPLERSLDESGAIRVVAEPFLGSRPEELFGMVENQTMPLEEMLHIISDHGIVEELTLAPDLCMGEFEREILANREKGADHLIALICDYLVNATEQAEKFMGANDRAMGYSLPNFEEIASMSELVADSVGNLTGDDDAGARSEELAIGLSNIFGASVSALMRKTVGGGFAERECVYRYHWGEKDSVLVGYPREIQDVLTSTVDLLPDIQRAQAEQLVKSFASDQWAIHQDDSGTRTIRALQQSSTIACQAVPQKGQILVLLRIYAVYEDAPYRISLEIDGEQHAALDIYQTDSYLMRASLNFAPADLKLDLSSAYFEKEHSKELPVYNISAARVCGA